MTSVVRTLATAFLERDELVAEIDESHALALASQLEIEEPTIEGQCFLDVAYLQCYVIEAHGAGLFRIGHYSLLRCDR